MKLEQIVDKWHSRFNQQLNPQQKEIVESYLKGKNNPKSTLKRNIYLDDSYLLTVLAGETPVKVVGENGKLEEKYLTSLNRIYLLKPSHQAGKGKTKQKKGEVQDPNLRAISNRFNSRRYRSGFTHNYYSRISYLSRHPAAIDNLGKGLTSKEVAHTVNPEVQRGKYSKKEFTQKDDLDQLRKYILGRKPIQTDEGWKRITSVNNLQLISYGTGSKSPDLNFKRLRWRFANRKHNPGDYLSFPQAVEKILSEKPTIRYFGTRPSPDSWKGSSGRNS